jgi:hypothetical protein
MFVSNDKKMCHIKMQIFLMFLINCLTSSVEVKISNFLRVFTQVPYSFMAAADYAYWLLLA